MCFDRGVQDFLPLISILSVDSLSWCIMLCSTLYPCASMKYFVHSTVGRKLSVPTSSDSEELFVSIFCPDDLLITTPWPKISAPQVCPLQSSCIWCAASIFQFKLYIVGILQAYSNRPCHEPWLVLWGTKLGFGYHAVLAATQRAVVPPCDEK